MSEQLVKLLSSELESVNAYLQNLIHQINRQYDSHRTAQIFWQAVFPATKGIYEQIGTLVSFPLKLIHKDSNLKIWLREINHIMKLIQSLTHIATGSKEVVGVSIDIINKLYEIGYHLHQEIGEDTQVQLPRVNLVKVKYVRNTPWYFLEKERILGQSFNGTEIISFSESKQIYSEEYISKGKSELKRKNYQKALDHFKKAYKLWPSAKGLTFIAWSYSLFGDVDKAKHFCFKAIKHDPEYGNAYNDLGSYYFSQGKFEFAAKWFKKAKKAQNQVNRELPYVNLGKVYLVQKHYHDALAEFKKAAEIVPHQKEIKKTIEKLEDFIKMQDSKAFKESDIFNGNDGHDFIT